MSDQPSAQTNISGDVHGPVYSGNIGQIGDNYFGAAGPDWPLFVNVPPKPRLVVGREAVMDRLVARLCAGTSTALSAEGLPGVGKTTLAVALAHDPRILAHFADGVLWAGLGPNGDPVEALGRWAGALHIDVSDKADARGTRRRHHRAHRRTAAAACDRRRLARGSTPRCCAVADRTAPTCSPHATRGWRPVLPGPWNGWRN